MILLKHKQSKRIPVKSILILLLSLHFLACNSIRKNGDNQTTQYSGNPIIKHIRTADPSAHVWADGKVWIYTSHDMDDAVDYGSMDGYHSFSSSDMVNWTDHGEILHSRDVPWGTPGGMWAPSAAYKNGKYYLFFPHATDGTRDNMRCGVAVSNTPEGPFKYEGWIKGVEGRWLDPCAFTDTDGSIYLYWGIEDIKVAKLKDNLLELAETPRKIDYGIDNQFEGIYMHKYKKKYYLSYRAKKGGYYSMGDSPYGPFVSKGVVNPSQVQDHHSIIEYKGQSYFFYHVQNYNGGTAKRRNVCVDYLNYNEDGTMQSVYPTTQGVKFVKK